MSKGSIEEYLKGKLTMDELIILVGSMISYNSDMTQLIPRLRD